MPDLEGLISRLIENEVRFVVVGGFAAVAHGGTLVTQDIDVCCEFSPQNLMKVQAAVADLHPVHRLTPEQVPLRLTTESSAGLMNLYLDTDLGQLDCLGSITGLGDFATVLDHSLEVQLSCGRCRILKLDALIASKKAMGRPRDNEAALQLEAIQDEAGKVEDEPKA